jgi:hypothetical protein
MADDDENVCEHTVCSCVVQEDAEYCSLYCEEADEAEVTHIACECGHPACVGERH